MHNNPSLNGSSKYMISPDQILKVVSYMKKWLKWPLDLLLLPYLLSPRVPVASWKVPYSQLAEEENT